MHKFKKPLYRFLALFLLCAAGIAVFLSGYHILDSRLYPKNAAELDLRGQSVSVEHYAQLRQTMPDCQILWDVPFQAGLVPSDSSELVLSRLSPEDISVLQYFPSLKTVHAEDCTDFPQLLALMDAYPELDVICSMPVGGTVYSLDTASLQLSGITAEDIPYLTRLPNLKSVSLSGIGDAEALIPLRDHCFGNGIRLEITVDSRTFSSDDRELTIEEVSESWILPLSLMTQLETLHLPEPEIPAEMLVHLAESLPDTKVTWTKTILGVTFPSDATLIDLTEIIALSPGQVLGDRTPYQAGLEYHVQGTPEEVASSIKVSKFNPLPDKTDETKALIEEVESAMAYFPEAEKLVMCGSYLHNIHMSNFRERHREDYKVVWSVRCGELATRTDAKLFMPVKYHVYYFFTEDAYNLKFCEEMEAIDIGHMLVDDISFVEYMPNLKYLILTLGSVEDISPLSTCKNLVFLEMDWTSVTDYSPLLGCTALEDLNIGQTFGNIAPILEMSWLKNLWLVGCYVENIWMAAGSLPDTHIGAFYGNPDDGWRQLPNYFAMRDALLMYYML